LFGAVEHGLQSRQTVGVDLGGVDGDGRRRLEARHLDRSRGDLPAEGDGLGRVVDRRVRLLRRSREGAVDQVQLVPVVGTVNVVADAGTVRQPEGLARLLTDRHTSHRSRRATALSELVRVGERLDRPAELLGRDEVEVLDVVRVLRVGLGARRRLGDGRQTVPSNTRRVSTVRVPQVEDPAVDAGLVVPLTDLILLESYHDGASFLKI